MVNERHIIRKVTWRLLPFFMLLFFFNFIDRVNVGFAAIEMNRDIGLSPTIFGWGAGAFFVSYAICQIPSSLLLDHLRIKLWIAGIAVIWGIASTSMAWVNGPKSFIALRFLLGFAEAGFFPGLIYYFGFWFPETVRGRINALLMIAVPVASMLGNPLSGLILSIGDNIGIAGWRWLFILEGTPSILLGVLAFFWLDDDPSKARWLTSDEREWLSDNRAFQSTAVSSVREALTMSFTDPRALFLSIVSFCFIMGIYGVGFWLPQIVAGFGATMIETGLVTAIPYAFATVAMLLWSTRSDSRSERRMHIGIPALLSGASLAATAYTNSPVLSLVGLSVAAACIFSANTIFWALPSSFVVGRQAAVTIAMINSIGNLGGFTGPYLVGWLKDRTGGFETALTALGAITITGGIMILFAQLILNRKAIKALA